MNIHVLARGTSGFSGADLANLVNEAALNAARYNQKVVRMLDFEFAKDKVLMGSERRSMIITDEEKKVTAIHEAGHALLAVLLPHADPVHKVTIIPRGMALGVTMQLPVDDKHNYSRDYLNDQIAILLGGRIAEEITTDGMTTGAGNDLERSTELARKMVCEWGMSDALGPLTFGKKEEQIFLGREIAQHKDYSEDTAIRIDQEIKRIHHDQLRARRARSSKRTASALDKIAEELLVREVLDAEQVRAIADGKALEEYKPVAPAGSRRRRVEARPEGAAVDRAAAAAAQQAAPAGIDGAVGVKPDPRGRRSPKRPAVRSGLRMYSPMTITSPAAATTIPLPGRAPLVLGERTLVMGILNVTPDSFADGGVNSTIPTALSSAGLQMVAEGADILDVGGESTRPGAEPVPEDEELRRVLPVVERLAQAVDVPISIDTYKAAVAREASRRGADDRQRRQQRCSYDAGLAQRWRGGGAALVLMHNRGRSRRHVPPRPSTPTS